MESNDGRVHLEQALPVIEAGKPLFIDKPMAGSLADVIAIFEAAEAKKVPRVQRLLAALDPPGPGAPRRRPGRGRRRRRLQLVPPSSRPTPTSTGTASTASRSSYTVMGTGCRSVSRFRTEDTEFCVGAWEGGRIGTFRGLRSSEHSYGGTVFAEKKIEYLPMVSGYDPLVKAIALFFATGQSPVPQEETIEIYAFMSAADKSKALSGRPVLIADVIAEARAEAARRAK